MFLYYALSAVIDTLYKDFEIKKYILIKSIISEVAILMSLGMIERQ